MNPRPGAVGVAWKSKVPHGNGRNPELLAPTLRNHFVYWLYNSAGECLYVGCTRLPEARWKQHQKERPLMVAETVECRMAGPYSYAVARRIERAQQYDLRPKFVGAIPITRFREDAHWSSYASPTYVGGDA